MREVIAAAGLEVFLPEADEAPATSTVSAA
jgi:hypothetical protein